MKKWITESALCLRWNINKYDLRDMILHRKLQPFYQDYSGLIIYDGGTAIEYPDGSFTTSPEPVTAAQVTGCIYLMSEVEEYEKKNGITPLTLPTDDHCDRAPIIARKENADDTAQKNRVDTPLFDRQVWEEALRLYEILLEIGFDGPGIGEKLKSVAKKELTQNSKSYQFIKQNHLNSPS